MTPGPSEPEPEVLSTMALPVIPHYGEFWKSVYEDTTSKLKKIFKTEGDVIIVPGPGQLAVEMAVANFVAKGEKAFVCVNGHFSSMIVEMIKYWGGIPVVIEKPWGEPITGEDVSATLDNHRDVSNKPLFIVHNETSTGVQNPVEDILRVCTKHDMLKVLDSISSFGGIDIKVDEWKADYTIGYASKALGGVFGAVPIAISERGWQAAKSNSEIIHSRFMNLNVWKKAIIEMGTWGHPHPCSMPTSIVVALRKAAGLALQEGLDNRYRRHKEVAAFAREQFAEIGLELFPKKEYASDTVCALKADPKWESKLRSELISRFGIMISGGLGKLEGRLVRIGHMGTSARKSAILTTRVAIESILAELRG